MSSYPTVPSRGRAYDLQYVINLHFETPNPLGEDEHKFSGINLYLHRLTDDVIDVIGLQKSPDFMGTVDIEIKLPLPEFNDTWRFYAVSVSDTRENDLILKGLDDETPYVDVDVLVNPYDGFSAPDVLLFNVGTLELDGTYTSSSRWDHTIKNLLFDWGAVLQEDISNWESLVIFVKTADNTYIQISGELTIESWIIQEDGTFSIRDTISISGVDLPATPETWTFIACSRNSLGFLNVDGSNNPIGPTVDINTLSLYAPQVTDEVAVQGTGKYTEQGEETFFLHGSYTAPSDITWESVEITALWDGDSDEIVLGVFGREEVWATDAWPLGQSRGITIKFYSISTGGTKNTVSPPSVAFDVEPTSGSSGIEYAPLVTGVTAVRSTPIRYGDTTNFNSPGSIELYGFTLGWTNPGNDDYSGVKIYVEFPDAYKVLVGSEDKPSTSIKTDEWAVGSVEFLVKIWFVSYRGVLTNSIVNGVTPKVQITITPTTLGTIKGSQVVDIPTASFASGLKPVELVTSLPGLPNAAYPVGTPVFKTNDNPPTLYRVDTGGNSWTKEVTGGDIVARSILGGSMVIGAIATSELYAGELLIGQGGGKPTRFKVVDSDGNMISFIGDDPSVPLLGGYFKNLWIGPTISDIRFSASGSGVNLDNVVLRVTKGGTTVNIDPGATFSPFRVSGSSSESVVDDGIIRAQSIDSSNRYPLASIERNSSNCRLEAYSGPFSSDPFFAVLASGSTHILTCDLGITSLDRLLKIKLSSGADNYADFRSMEIKVGGTTIIDASRNCDFASVKVGGTTRIGSSGQSIPRYFTQVGRPTLDDGEAAMWWDTSNMNWLVRIGANYFKIQMVGA